VATAAAALEATVVPCSGKECCAICVEEVRGAFRLRCRHGWYCTRCLQRYAEQRLSEGFGYVLCPEPECGVPLSEADLRKLLPKALVSRLAARAQEHAAFAAGDSLPCPTPDCPERAVPVDGGAPGLLTCLRCANTVCKECGAHPYHEGLTCAEHAEATRAAGEEGAEESFRRWMQETGTRQCPQCGMAITKEHLEKQKGQHAECHKMLCRNCGYRFCFKCLARLTATKSCRCSNMAHGFIDPRTGKRLTHLSKQGRANH
jgi:hypothetical protein